MTPTRKLPLFLVSGASCVGKSSLCEVLFRREQDFLRPRERPSLAQRIRHPRDAVP